MVKNPTLIVIDDNQLNLFLFKKLSTRLGIPCRVQTYSNAIDAFNVISLKTVLPGTFIFVSDDMPVMDGYEFAHQYGGLSNEIHNMCTLVMTTTFVDDMFKHKLSRYKIVEHYLEKPIQLDQVVNILK